MTDARQLVNSCYVALAARNVAAALDHLADHCMFTIHVPPDVMSFAGAHFGKAAIKACLNSILTEFSYLTYAPLIRQDSEDTVRYQVHYHFRHRVSGAEIEGRFRHVWRVSNGKVVQRDSYHDVALWRAFMQMARSGL